jgi:hypothetical protein
MRKINSAPGFFLFALSKAIRHPLTRITYNYCSKCGVRIPAEQKECPACGKKLKPNPGSRSESPIPWWGALICIVIGIAAWIVGVRLQVTGLDEAGHVLVYIPVGSLFGMTVKKG